MVTSDGLLPLTCGWKACRSRRRHDPDAPVASLSAAGEKKSGLERSCSWGPRLRGAITSNALWPPATELVAVDSQHRRRSGASSAFFIKPVT